MANMTLEKTPMPEQDPKVRARNFKEVTLGYTAEMAINEANRHLPSFKQVHEVEIRYEEFEKTTSRKIKRYAIK